MLQSVFSAATGLSAQQKRLDNIGNNIANINTIGYKGKRIDFKDCVATTMESPIQPQDDMDLEKNVGVLISSTKTGFTQGAVTETGIATDLAISGEGFFVLEDAEGGQVYTRSGSFSLSEEEDGCYLTDGNGRYLLDENGQRARFPDSGVMSVNAEGELLDGSQISEDGLAQPYQRLMIVGFPNAEGLLEAGQSGYIVSESSGQPEAAEDYEICQGFLERSNVQLEQEMSLLIRTQRAYSLASRALQTADSMDGLANNMRR